LKVSLRRGTDGKGTRLAWVFIVKKLLVYSLAATALYLPTAPASAASCYDLWYRRNEVFAANGYCFKTQLGIDTFGNADCYTSTPKLTRAERREVNAIKAQEKKQGCKVN
jgi:YARHG domain